MGLKAKVLALLDQAYEKDQEYVTGMSDAERSSIGAPDHWSAKDVIAHSAIWKQRSVQRLAATPGDGPPDPPVDFEQVNTEIFEEYRAAQWTAVLDLSKQAHNNLVEQTQALGEDDLLDEQRFPQLEGRTPMREIVGHGYIHPLAHLAELHIERGENDRATLIQESMAESLAELDASPSWMGTIAYNLACHYALCGETKKAIGKLAEALQLNPDLLEWSKADSDLESLRDDPSYKSLYASS